MRLQEVNLITGSLTQCRVFYAELLGLEVKEVSSTGICFKVGSGLLRFREVAHSHPRYHMAFSIPNNMLHASLEWLGQRTVILPYSPESVIADFTGWNAKAFYFRDADENILECITHFDQQTYRAGAFSGDCFASIMEIGLAVEDVTAACADFNGHYGLPYYAKGPRLKDFSVMGDEEGMLIVTKKGRGWLPTQEAAEPFPVRLLIEHYGKTSHLEFV
jgi:catechol 2,3-dioxygenase-like lactoylglutathione lyase family enzyme